MTDTKDRLNEILDEWDVDGVIDETNLSRAALSQPRLHGKYLRKLSNEKLRLKTYTGEASMLRRDKYEFFTLGPTKETAAKGWEMPPQGRILNKDAAMYIDADPDIIAMNLKLAYQAEVVAALELIMKEIGNRNWSIGRSIDFQKLQAGVG